MVGAGCAEQSALVMLSSVQISTALQLMSVNCIGKGLVLGALFYGELKSWLLGLCVETSV